MLGLQELSQVYQLVLRVSRSPEKWLVWVSHIPSLGGVPPPLPSCGPSVSPPSTASRYQQARLDGMLDASNGRPP